MIMKKVIIAFSLVVGLFACNKEKEQLSPDLSNKIQLKISADDSEPVVTMNTTVSENGSVFIKVGFKTYTLKPEVGYSGFVIKPGVNFPTYSEILSANGGGAGAPSEDCFTEAIKFLNDAQALQSKFATAATSKSVDFSGHCTLVKSIKSLASTCGASASGLDAAADGLCMGLSSMKNIPGIEVIGADCANCK
jgi:hypothetical protein